MGPFGSRFGHGPRRPVKMPLRIPGFSLFLAGAA